jgi:hypothetical protein
MASFSSRSRQSSPYGHFQPLSPLPSRPSSPLSSPPLTSHGPSHSASSSTPFLNHNQDSTTQLPRYPLPTFRRSPSSTSLTSEYDECDDSTACPTPNPESLLGDGNQLYNINLAAASKSVCSFKTYINPDTYIIETLHEHDDADLLVPWKRKIYRLSPLFTFLAVAAYFLYYGYRIHCTVYAQRAYHKTYIMAWLFIAAEGCVACKSSQPEGLSRLI